MLAQKGGRGVLLAQEVRLVSGAQDVSAIKIYGLAMCKCATCVRCMFVNKYGLVRRDPGCLNCSHSVGAVKENSLSLILFSFFLF